MMGEASRQRLWHILHPDKPYRPKGIPMNIIQTDSDSITFPITFRELADSLQRLGYASFTTDQHALKIFNDVKEHREPVWGVGDLVLSSGGAVYERLQNQRWKRLDGDRDPVVKDDYPSRPLKKIGRA
jgi:hypothetical protein